MKKVVMIIIVLVLAIAVWFVVFRKKSGGDDSPKPKPVATSKHSDSLNNSFRTMISDYYGLVEGFVNWDSSVISGRGNDLKSSLAAININELKKDSTIYLTAVMFWDNAKSETDRLLQEPVMEEKRRALNSVSENLYNFLRTVHYDLEKLYWQECPMAFNDTEPGYWLSRTDSVRNPYLGTRHPKYKSGMLNCGGPKDTINYTGDEVL